MRKTWYNFSPDSATLTIYDDLGAWGVSAKDFLADLRAVNSDNVTVEINSPGGDVFAGLAIYNGLRASNKHVTVKVLGLAASAASLVAMAGDEIEMPENTMMMIHNPWSMAMGSADDLRETADVLDKIGASLVSTYAKRTGKSEAEIKEMLDAETWLTAQEALDMGFATKVTPAIRAHAKFDLDRLPEAARKVFAQAQADANTDEVVAPTDTVAPTVSKAETVQEPTFAEQVQKVAEENGVPEYAAAWAADPAVATVADAVNRAKLARETKSLCAVVQRPELADKAIKSCKTLAEVRQYLFEVLANDEHIDTSPKAKDTAQSKGAQPVAVKIADIWAARRKQLQGV